jgi:chromosome segregation ATPase
MSAIVSSKLSHFENLKKRLDVINEDLNNAHIFENNNLPDRIRYLINHNKQVESIQNDITNKYQALLLQTNMLTSIIKQHSTEVANHKTNEEQLKEFNEQLLNENQQVKIEIQEYRSKLLQISNTTNQLEHENSLNKQHTRDLQIHYETLRAENQVLANVKKPTIFFSQKFFFCSKGFTNKT